MGELGQGRKRPNISNDSALKGNATTEAKIIMHLNDSDKERDKGKTRLYVSPSLTCLLYTSPSPRDVHKSRMPSSA